MADIATRCQVKTPVEPREFERLAGVVLRVPSVACPATRRIDDLGGERPIDIADRELTSHARRKPAVQFALDALATENDEREVLGDGGLFASEVADSGTEPDAMLCPFESIESGHVRCVEPVPDSGRLMTVAGRPDLFVEIVSNSSVEKDTRERRSRDFAAGVRVYRILGTCNIRRPVTLLLRGNNKRIVASN